MEPFFVYLFVFSGFKISPHLLQLLRKNTATLFRCEAPEIFCCLRNITQLSISMGGGDDHFWASMSFKTTFLYTHVIV